MFALAGLVVAWSPPHAAAQSKPLAKGDRIVFLGDSITAAGVRPGGYVTLVREEITKRHPDLKIEIIGAGISGHKVPDCQQRLMRDVISKRPTIVVIYIGINDVWHWNNNRGTKKEDFDKGLRDLVARINAAGARVILGTPSVIGEKTDGSNKFDKMLDEYSDISRKVAKETGSQLLDLRKAFVGHLKQHNAENAARGVLTSDTVHLNAAGNRFVADQVLAALHAKDEKAGGSRKLLRHVVLFQFKETSGQQDVDRLVEEFGKLPRRIKLIHGYEWGTDNSPEGLSTGLTHCFLVTFTSEQNRDAYLPHPAHQQFVKLLKPHLEKVLVVDYWAR